MSYDYSKIAEEDWHDGAPDNFAIGMVLETENGYDLIGHRNTFRYWGSCEISEWSTLLKDYKILRWAWLPGFEPEGE